MSKSQVTYVDRNCSGCGRKFRSACTEQWQIDYANTNKLAKLCDDCVIAIDPHPGKGDREDAQIEFQTLCKEMHDQQEAARLCQTM